ncbi:hypothetical protein ACWCSH_40200, partial [Streptosporangium sp. NPDC001682]
RNKAVKSSLKTAIHKSHDPPCHKYIVIRHVCAAAVRPGRPPGTYLVAIIGLSRASRRVPCAGAVMQVMQA